MSFEQRDIIRHEDVVINDDQIVLPSESKTVPKRCHESWGISGELPEEMHAFVEEMGITCEDIEFCKFQEYNEEERGVIGGSLQDGSHCTINYLETVWYNYCLVQWFCLIKGDEGPEDIEELFSPTRGELQRLQEHPELFPSQEAEQNFWHRLKKVLERITQARFVIHEHDKRHAAFVSHDEEEMHAELMPESNFWRKPWEQYLHNRAPGVNVDLSEMGGDGSIQILPMGALRLLHGMKEANASIIRGIEAARRARGVDMPYQVGGRDPTLLGVSTVSPEGHRRTHKLRSDLLTPIENGSEWKSRPFADAELETLNEDFTAMSRRREPGGRPVHWNFLCLVVHDHPSYGGA